jgi:hypothetical protein
MKDTEWQLIETAPEETEILVYSRSIWIASCRRGIWIDVSDSRTISIPSHWMPLPELPLKTEKLP